MRRIWPLLLLVAIVGILFLVRPDPPDRGAPPPPVNHPATAEDSALVDAPESEPPKPLEPSDTIPRIPSPDHRRLELYGSVRFEEGGFVAGATVDVYSSADRWKTLEHVRTTTDHQGRFVRTWTGVARVDVVCTVFSGSRATADVYLTRTQDLDLRLPRAAMRHGELRGTRHELLAGTVIRFRPDLCRHMSCGHPGARCDRVALLDEEVVTDASGQFRVSSVHRRLPYVVEVIPPGQPSQTFRLDPSTAERLELKLSP
jgi:hypothetical protein